jgi:hypothetical protein
MTGFYCKGPEGATAYTDIQTVVESLYPITDSATRSRLELSGELSPMLVGDTKIYAGLAWQISTNSVLDPLEIDR